MLTALSCPGALYRGSASRTSSVTSDADRLGFETVWNILFGVPLLCRRLPMSACIKATTACHVRHERRPGYCLCQLPPADLRVRYSSSVLIPVLLVRFLCWRPSPPLAKVSSMARGTCVFVLDESRVSPRVSAATPERSPVGGRYVRKPGRLYCADYLQQLSTKLFVWFAVLVFVSFLNTLRVLGATIQIRRSSARSTRAVA